MTKLEKLITPTCEVLYPCIFRPNVKHVKDGVFSVNCVIEDTPEWKTLLSHLESRLKDFYQAQCTVSNRKLKLCPHTPWKKMEDGRRVLVAKNNRIGTRKDGKTFEVKPIVVGPDPNVTLTAEDFEGPLGNGTKARVGFTVNLWSNDAQGVGMTARLAYVQIIEPVIYDGLGSFVDLSQPEGAGFQKVQTEWFKPKDKPLTPQTKPKTLDVDGMEVDDILGMDDVDPEFLTK